MSNYNNKLQTNNSELQTILEQISNLPEQGTGNGLDTSDATATASDILSGKTAYVDGEKIVGNISTKTSNDLTTNGATVTVPAGYYASQVTKSVNVATQATPSITINSTGLITAAATQTAGYVAAGTKSATKQLTTKGATTVTPTTTNQTAVSSGVYTTGAITVQGDSNLIAENIKDGINIFGVTGNYAGDGSSSGTDEENTDIIDNLISRTLTSYTNDRITNVGNNAFAECVLLTTVNFPNCSKIGANAFSGCNNLTTVSFPKCTTIFDSAFYLCKSLQTAYFPVCTSISRYAFFGCSNLRAASFPMCYTVGNYAFQTCPSLTTLSFPECTEIGAGAFQLCSRLTTASFPKCITIGNSAFSTGYSLKTISFPVCTTIGQYAFQSCSSLTTVSFPKCTALYANAFFACSKLSKIYLKASTLCTLSHSNAFSKTLITSSTGSIYVPASLLTSYKTATNWTYFSNRIFSA